MNAARLNAGVLLYTPDDAMQTMQRMAALVRHALHDPYVVRRANEVIAAARPRDYVAQIEAIRSYVQELLFFVDNPIGMQRVQCPAYLLHDIDARGYTQGACDDAAMLIAALGMANGIPAEFVAYAFGHAGAAAGAAEPAVPYTHVIAHLYDGTDWVMLDVTRPDELHRLPDVLRTLTLSLADG